MIELDGSISEEYLRCDGVRFRFLHAGAGRPLVLVHGLLGYSHNWRYVIPILAGNREVFAPDMPGAGFSECPAGLDGRLSSAAKRLLGFLDAAGIGTCDLVGSSYGGATAVILVGFAPSRIRSLILVSPANSWSRNGRKRLALLQQRTIAWLFPKVARSVRPMHRYFVRRMWGDPRRVTAETLLGYSLPLVRPGIFEHSVKIVQTWQQDMAELQATLPKIGEIPTLLIWGSRDRVVDPRSAESIRKVLPNSKIAIIRGAGHLPYEESPEEFARIVQEFLSGAEAGQITSSAREVT